MQTHTSALPATHQTTPLEAAFAQGGFSLPVTYHTLSAQVIRDLPLENVQALLHFIAEAKSELATLTTLVQAGLEMRFVEAAKHQLLVQGKDTGTTHITDGGFDISVEIGKDVKWDQKALPAIWDRIAATGDDPRQYIDVKYSVSEAKFKAWPDTLKKPFEAARTVTPGKPKFALRPLEKGAV